MLIEHRAVEMLLRCRGAGCFEVDLAELAVVRLCDGGLAERNGRGQNGDESGVAARERVHGRPLFVCAARPPQATLRMKSKAPMVHARCAGVRSHKRETGFLWDRCASLAGGESHAGSGTYVRPLSP